MDTLSYLSLPILLLLYVVYRFNRLLKEGKNRKDGDDKFSPVVLSGRIGATIGGICGFILPPIYYQLTNPEILNDGQWGLVYLAALPVGIVIGAVIGCVVGVMFANKK
jgi:hypothetical protein